MNIIAVDGANSGDGPTTVLEILLRHFKNYAAIKTTTTHKTPCPRIHACGICREIKKPYNIITDPGIIAQEDKDTARYLSAGAKKVLWVQSAPDALREAMKEALELLKDEKGVIIEGNSPLKYIRPDLTIFVRADDEDMKPSAKAALPKADISVISRDIKKREFLAEITEILK